MCRQIVSNPRAAWDYWDYTMVLRRVRGKNE
jgi:hypothetical protein